MITFASEFPVDPSINSGELLDIAKEWLDGSMHSSFDFSALEEAGLGEEWRVSLGSEALEGISLANEQKESYAIRYRKVDGSLEWITSVVLSKGVNSSWIGIRVERVSFGPLPNLPNAKKPYIVKLILERCASGFDGAFPISDLAHKLCDSDVLLAKKLVLGGSGCYLPVVYISASFDGSEALNVDRLASSLSGLAHVVVEPNYAFSRRLQFEVESRNIYGGGIRVYWPDKSGRQYSYFPREYGSPGGLAKEIIFDVRRALVHRRPLVECTWSGVKRQVSKQKIDELRRTGNAELDEYLEAFDQENAAIKEDLEAARKEIARLQNDIEWLESKDGDSILQRGSEPNYYPGETLAVVLEELERAGKNVAPGSRRQHLLSSVLAANSSLVELNSLRAGIRDLFRGYRKLTPRVRSELSRLGFDVDESGKHNKATYMNDDRYMVTFPKTGSDHRGGLNIAANLIKEVF